VRRTASQVNWASGIYGPRWNLPHTTSAWDRLLREMGVSERAVIDGTAEDAHIAMLRKWAERNHDKRFVPDELVVKWGLIA